VREVEGEKSQSHHCAFKNVEVDLSSNNSSSPSISQLDGSVDSTDEQENGTEDHSDELEFHAAVQEVPATLGRGCLGPDWEIMEEAVEVFGGANNVYRDGEELEDDAAQHDIATHVSSFKSRCGRRPSASNTLDAQRDVVKHAKDDQVPLRAETAIRWSQTENDLLEDNKVRGQ